MKFSSSVTAAMLASASLVSRTWAFGVVRHATTSSPALIRHHHHSLMNSAARATSAAPVSSPSFSRSTSTTATTTTTLSMANVLKLSDPQSELLDQVDVFIFDCDGVIWRVRVVVWLPEVIILRHMAMFLFLPSCTVLHRPPPMFSYHCIFLTAIITIFVIIIKCRNISLL
jgi:hypothetical protein